MKPRHVLRSLARAVVALGSLAYSGLTQAQPGVGSGELPFNAGIYKASHNSYDRDESYASQIDNWNCWCVELDLHWHEDTIQVHHLCEFGGSGPALSTALEEVARSTEQYDRVTVVYLELKGACGSSWPSRQTYRFFIRSAVNAAFGSAVYPSTEFKTIDQSCWPSYQEMLRRGYRWVVILDEEETGFADDDLFFGMARGNPPTEFEANSVLINSGLGSAIPDRGDQPERWMFRAYPGPYCDVADDEEYFDGAIARGYTFIATNCIDRHYTMTPSTHSPSPVRVTNGGSGTEFGTLSFPYRFGAGLLRAVLRASPMVPVNIIGGVYFVPRGTRLDRPIVLRASGGPVRIASQ